MADLCHSLSRTYLKTPCVCPCLTHPPLIRVKVWFDPWTRLAVCDWVSQGDKTGGLLGPWFLWWRRCLNAHPYPYVSEMNSPSDARGLGLHLGSIDNATLIFTVVYIVWPDRAPPEMLPPTLLAGAESYGRTEQRGRIAFACWSSDDVGGKR